MNTSHNVLVVDPEGAVSLSLQSSWAAAGCEITVASTFAAARTHLERQPAAVVTLVRLGAYNGLHVALRAHAKGIPAVVIGERNTAMECEARAVGAAYLALEDIQAHDLCLLVRVLVQQSAVSVDPGLPFSVAWALATRSGAAASRRYTVH